MMDLVEVVITEAEALVISRALGSWDGWMKDTRESATDAEYDTAMNFAKLLRGG